MPKIELTDTELVYRKETYVHTIKVGKKELKYYKHALEDSESGEVDADEGWMDGSQEIYDALSEETRDEVDDFVFDIPFEGKKPRQKLVIPFSESDCQDIENGETFDWTFTTDQGESIDIHLRLETEEDIG